MTRSGTDDISAPGPEASGGGKPRTVYVRLPGRESPLVRKIELMLTMFPGHDRMVLYFEDTGKKLSAPCLIHEALLAELNERCGEKNVVVK